MKKLLLLLVIVPFLAACSSDKEEVDPNVYIDKSVILGGWDDNRRVPREICVFYRDRVEFYTYEHESNIIVNHNVIKNYRLTKDKIFFNKSTKGNPYYIVKDTLFINESPSHDNIYTQYVRIKS